MTNQLKLLEPVPGSEVSRTVEPEFYRLYQQSVLLALKEMKVIKQPQLQWCLEHLSY